MSRQDSGSVQVILCLLVCMLCVRASISCFSHGMIPKYDIVVLNGNMINRCYGSVAYGKIPLTWTS